VPPVFEYYPLQVKDHVPEGSFYPCASPKKVAPAKVLAVWIALCAELVNNLQERTAGDYDRVSSSSEEDEDEKKEKEREAKERKEADEKKAEDDRLAATEVVLPHK
jgi:hypothetical protein